MPIAAGASCLGNIHVLIQICSTLPPPPDCTGKVPDSLKQLVALYPPKARGNAVLSLKTCDTLPGLQLLGSRHPVPHISALWTPPHCARLQAEIARLEMRLSLLERKEVSREALDGRDSLAIHVPAGKMLGQLGPVERLRGPVFLSLF